MLKVYGSSLCPDCQDLRKAFDSENIEYEYHDITSDLRELKFFLTLRDTHPKFAKAKSKGLIGIPIVQTDDGTLTYKWQDFIKSHPQISKCSEGFCGLGK